MIVGKLYEIYPSDGAATSEVGLLIEAKEFIGTRSYAVFLVQGAFRKYTFQWYTFSEVVDEA